MKIMKMWSVLCLSGAVFAFGAGFMGDGGKWPVAAAATQSNEVQIFRDSGEWKARFRFAQDAPVWAFERSALLARGERPWRPESWTIETPGVTLERIGDFDVFIADADTVPREVMISFRPLAKDLIADQNPAIILTDGSLALSGGHFLTFPVEGRRAVEKLHEPRDFSSRISLTAGGVPLLFKGQRMTHAEDIGNNYVYIGDVKLEDDAAVATILDPGLPHWISALLRDFTPAVFSSYERQMGPHNSTRPMMIVSWGGTEALEQGVNGSVSSGLITMRIGSRKLLNETPSEGRFMQWFIAHEAAHFWLGQTVGYATRDDMWITEGGADFLAMSMIAERNPDYDAEGFVARARIDCVASLRLGPLAEARKRNDQRAYYACGTLFAMAVDRAGRSRGQGFADFVRRLIAVNNDGQVAADEWLAAARAFGVDATRIALIEAMIGGNVEAEPMIDALLAD